MFKCFNCSEGNTHVTFKDVSSPEKLNEEENDQKGFVITMFDGEAKQLGIFKLEDVQKMFKDHKIYAVKLGASCSSTQQTCNVGVFFAVIKKLAKREKAVPEDKTMAELIHNSLKRATIKRKRTQNGKFVQVEERLLSDWAMQRAKAYAGFASRMPTYAGHALSPLYVKDGWKDAIALDYEHFEKHGKLRLKLHDIMRKSSYAFTKEEEENILKHHDDILRAVRTEGHLSAATVEKYNLPVSEEDKQKRQAAEESDTHYVDRDDGNRSWSQGRVQVVTNTSLLKQRQADVDHKKDLAKEKERKKKEAQQLKKSLQERLRDEKTVTKALRQDKRNDKAKIEAQARTIKNMQKEISSLQKKLSSLQKRAEEVKCYACHRKLDDAQGQPVTPSVACSDDSCPNWACWRCAHFKTASALTKQAKNDGWDWFCAAHQAHK